MPYIPLEELTKKNRSLFRLVLATAERANEINRGAKPIVKTSSKNPATIALEEFAASTVTYEQVEPKQEKPSEEETS